MAFKPYTAVLSGGKTLGWKPPIVDIYFHCYLQSFHDYGKPGNIIWSVIKVMGN